MKEQDKEPTSEEVIGAESLLKLTSDIVSAHVSNNSVQMSDITTLISSVYSILSTLSAGGADGSCYGSRVNGDLKPAVPIKKSVSADYVVCLEDGRKLKMLRRHLKTAYNMTPEEYRMKWGLPSDYPMVAPNYAATRQALARKIGLGRRRGSANFAGDKRSVVPASESLAIAAEGS